MRRMSFRTRALASVGAIALAGATSLVVLAPAASAVTDLATTLTPATTPTVYAGGTRGTAEVAGSWATSALPAMSAGDTVTIAIDDNDASPNCGPSAGDFIEFNGVPTVANTGVAGAAFTAAISSSTGACTSAGKKDVLTVTQNTAGPTPAGAVLTITGIKYNIGAGVTEGPIRTKVDGGSFSTAGANATVSDAVKVSLSSAPQLVAAGSTANALPSIVLTERIAAGVPTGTPCVQITSPAGPGGSTFTVPLTPTVSGPTGSNPVALPDTATTATFTTTGSANAGAYSISGLTALAGTAAGPLTASVRTSCGGAAFGPNMTLAYVGTVTRIAGGDRYGTAAQISETQFTGANGTPNEQCLADRQIVIARGDSFPDALAASYLAGANKVPILLTAPNSLAPETLQQLGEHGATSVVIVGGTAAISSSVETQLAGTAVQKCGGGVASPAANIAVIRVGGTDRYFTAKAVAEKPGLNLAGMLNTATDGTTCLPGKTMILASGENFPDALAAGGLAYTGTAAGGCGDGNPIPLMLTASASLSPQATGAITEMGINQVLLMGGTGAISQAVRTSLAGIAGLQVVNVAGTTRQGTAVALASQILGQKIVANWNANPIVPVAPFGFLVARGDTFPDALTASSASGLNQAPLYLSDSTTSLGATATAGIQSYPSSSLFNTGTLVGGTGALSAAVVTAAGQAIATQNLFDS